VLTGAGSAGLVALAVTVPLAHAHRVPPVRALGVASAAATVPCCAAPPAAASSPTRSAAASAARTAPVGAVPTTPRASSRASVSAHPSPSAGVRVSLGVSVQAPAVLPSVAVPVLPAGAPLMASPGPVSVRSGVVPSSSPTGPCVVDLRLPPVLGACIR
jgi:hypothetical protein